ncbi:MAG: polyprenyl synthetase family protein [Desulfovibrio sp.]|nr:polyprenyl synthetase family protein [Desulfovibrio sp.]
MPHILLKAKLSLELPRINEHLRRAAEALPSAVQPLVRHIFEAGGKRLRPLLTILTARLLNYDNEDIFDLGISLEMLHAATLLHDDVIDNAPVRRGKPAAHTLFSPTAVILAGDALLAEGNVLVTRFHNAALSHCFSKAISETCAGEIAEIESQRDPLVSLDRYLSIITGKTACLISSACKMGAIVAKAPENIVEAAAQFGENIGIAFQLVDDAIDFAREEETGKPSGGDLKEGKLTLPLRYYRESLTEKDREDFDEAFRGGNIPDDQCRVIAETIRRKGFDNKTRTYANSFLEKALKALDVLPHGKEKELLHEMTEFVRDRKK